MENYKFIYCLDCGKHTENVPKLSAVMSGNRVCKECSRMNGVYTLVKPNSNFIKTSSDINWVIYDEVGRFKETSNNIKAGSSLLMSPFNNNFTWLTTIVKEIIQENEFSVTFETENSIYKLYKPIE